MAVPTKDETLVPYSTNWANRITGGYATFGLTEDQANDYVPLQTAFLAAYNVMMNSREAGTRSRVQTINKDNAKAALLANLRKLYGVVQMSPAVSDGNKALLGVADRNPKPRPVPAPTVRPSMTIVRAFARTVVVSIFDPTSKSKRARLPSAASAFVYSYVGTTYPADPSLWQFCGAATKPTFDIVFSDATPSGSQVWVCCAWVTRRGDAGPSCVPISTNISGGGAGETATIKLAA